MNVGLNLVYLVPGETGGMETYARELIAAMASLSSGHRFTTFVSRAAADEPGPWRDIGEVVTVPVNPSRRTEWVRGEQQLLPRLAARAGCELVHSLASTAPLHGRFARVVTIHDLIYRTAPQAHAGLLALGMRVLVPAAAYRSDRIIVPSESTRADLLHAHRRLDPSRVDVIPQGVRLPAAGGDAGRARERFGLADRPLLLCLSALRPHKNLTRLIEALALIERPRRPLLVIAGYRTAHADELEERARALGVEADVRLPGWLHEQAVEDLYAAAAAFVFPSLYEGFGLPVLEAMVRGVPVATTDRGSLPEVAGDAALRFDPLNPRAIKDAVTRLLTDGALARRLVEAGRRRAEGFSWRATAEATLAVYQNVVKNG